MHRVAGGPGSHYGLSVAVDTGGRIAFGGLFGEEVDVGDDHFVNPNPESCSFDAVLAGFDAAGENLGSKQNGSASTDAHLTELHFDPADALFVTVYLDDALSVRLYAGGEQTWEWKTDQLALGRGALAGVDAVLVGAWPGKDVMIDFGGGPLVGRGDGDFFLAKIRR
ncbi:hypothetical protein SAMN02745121_05923 [Nannocystis exedens]|uniref:Concanavalin A-like lectin/glucanases superfamily protein n=1 Tax=Nannocystis exedens TaxID=54 RepID=A0A1I2E9A1_9BACT|nr:hypothetical protein [Nannocystis exedens]PCC74898.1 hypothetical protein NAEX_07998 [Nannocystis exedens]SFE89068.1 hypothetical protein SAMN02745121_05923 [Nannocystis exedens]